MGANITIAQEIKDEAKRLYFNHWTPKEISDFLQQEYETVRKWVTRYGWAKERKKIEDEEKSDVINRRSHQMNRVMRDGLEVIAEAIEGAKKGGVTMEDAERISKMIGNIDKVYRLQTGKPTEIKEERKITSDVATKQELLKAMSEDPFIEADFKDVTPSSQEG